MEAFYTIQGEGVHSGKSAYFIRLAGCDVGCHWCDVKESWETEGFPVKTAEELANEAAQYSPSIVVITGGEPAMYNLAALTDALQEKNLKTHMETSGAYPLTGKWDWVCVSPKKFKAPLQEVLAKADELKVIIFNKSDYRWAEEHAENVNAACALLLQPEWGKAEEMMPGIIDYVKTHPRWRISLQTHKYMQIP